MDKDLVFENVRLVDPARGLDAVGHLVARDGVVLTSGPGPVPAGLRTPPGSGAVDGRGKALLPGLFDLRAHLREPGYEDRETLESGCAAAAAGGYTDLLAMPNTRPCVDTASAVLFVRERGARSGRCRVHVAGALTRGMAGSEMVEYGDLVDAGAVAFTDDLEWVRDSGLMRHAMECARMFGVPVISHPEDASLSRNGVMHEGSWSTRLGLGGLPAAAEVSAVARDIELVRLTGAHLHVPHVSARASLQLIRAAKAQGLPVTAEVAPHHFCFTDADCRDYDTHFKMKPPLRGEDDRQALLEALADGTLDAIASDHAPHTITDKERTFAHAPFGVIGLETAFAAAHDQLVVGSGLGLLRLAELMSLAPARILGRPGRSLAEGARADLVLVDPEEVWTPRPQALFSRGRNCPWIGRPLRGRVRATWIEGRESFRLEDERHAVG